VNKECTCINVVAGGSRDDELSKVRLDPRVYDRKGFQSISSDAVMRRSLGVHVTAETPRADDGRAAVRGILKKTPASVNSVMLGGWSSVSTFTRSSLVWKTWKCQEFDSYQEKVRDLIKSQGMPGTVREKILSGKILYC